jgi:hypothetical protein
MIAKCLFVCLRLSLFFFHTNFPACDVKFNSKFSYFIVVVIFINAPTAVDVS